MHVERIALASAEDAARALATRPGLAWLDGDGSAAEGRFSYVASDPVEVCARTLGDARPLDAMTALGSAKDEASDAPRAPRWIGFVAYDAAWAPGGGMRRGARLERDATSEVLRFSRYDAIVAFEHGSAEAWLVGDDAEACARLRARLACEERLPVDFAIHDIDEPPAEVHLDAVRRALEHVCAGDLYQVNLARRWSAALTGRSPRGAALGLYLAMRAASPVPLGAYLDAGERALLSCTMERFLDWDGATLVTRPIKGTLARRGGDDHAEADALRADPKEHAEHTMIVDLMRNDLGRVAQTGSVRVPRLLEVEPYARLSHLVSTVTCRTREGITLGEVLEATFPPGSVTGAPKLRAMELIEALEPVPRGIYCGAVGFVDREGGLSLAVAIRTAVAAEGRVVYHAGGGLVVASVPERELAETELKARVFLDAAGAFSGGPSGGPRTD
jgi:anthranilate/para-aminobenzoate synthase component I